MKYRLQSDLIMMMPLCRRGAYVLVAIMLCSFEQDQLDR